MLVVWYIKHVRLYELHMYLMSICIAKRRPKQRKATRQSWRSQRCLCTNETFLFCLIYVFSLNIPHIFASEVHVKQELAEASLKATAFEQSLKGRVLSIKLSDSSNAPEPNLTAYTPQAMEPESSPRRLQPKRKPFRKPLLRAGARARLPL